MIRFKDFEPEELQKGNYHKQGYYRSFKDIVFQANNWLKTNDVKLINIETVVLPNIHNAVEDGTEDVALRTSSESINDWHQFVRIWYKE